MGIQCERRNQAGTAIFRMHRVFLGTRNVMSSEVEINPAGIGEQTEGIEGPQVQLGHPDRALECLGLLGI